MDVRAVFFDFGGTLFSYGTLGGHLDGLLVEMARRRGVEAPPAELRRRYREAVADAMRRFTPRPFYLHRELFADAHRAYLAGLGVAPEPEDEDVVGAGLRVLAPAAVEARADAAETLRALRERGLHLAVVSNIDDDQFAVLWERVRLAEHFHAVTTSEEARSCKPDPAIFHHALAKAGIDRPEQVVFVGDSLAHDVVGANALGMTSVLLAAEPPPEGTVRPHHVIRELGELREILGA